LVAGTETAPGFVGTLSTESYLSGCGCTAFCASSGPRCGIPSVERGCSRQHRVMALLGRPWEASRITLHFRASLCGVLPARSSDSRSCFCAWLRERAWPGKFGRGSSVIVVCRPLVVPRSRIRVRDNLCSGLTWIIPGTGSGPRHPVVVVQHSDPRPLRYRFCPES
jgi:hypothetical protein